MHSRRFTRTLTVRRRAGFQGAQVAARFTDLGGRKPAAFLIGTVPTDGSRGDPMDTPGASARVAETDLRARLALTEEEDP